jgi:hypothetical protein
VARWLSIAAGLALAAFVTAKGIPTLRHDWNWPIDRIAVGSFLTDATSGWLSIGFGVANPHPTTYLIGPPLAAIMWLAGPLAGLALLAFLTGYCCARAAASLAALWGATAPVSIGIALFLSFNPWVYNEVVAGHLVMVLAYGAFAGMLAEMARGRTASSVRLALWLVLIESQLQFFIVAMVVAAIFAIVTKKWLPLGAGALVALPSIVGLLGERSALLQIPYGVEWQANQSIAPLALLSLGGYFAGYADRLGVAAAIAVLAMLALAIAGTAIAWRRRAALWTALGALVVYLVASGVHGPLAVPYEWIVRNIPESGVFRELYDLVGIFAVSIAALASACASRARYLGFAALAAGVVLPVTWILRPPGDLWISSNDYPHPSIGAAPFSRIALLPAFQPMQLRSGRGDGADPDAFVYPDHVAPINEYYPTYPVDMALADYEQTGDVRGLQTLGVDAIVARPWLSSRSRGAIGLAASSLAAPARGIARSSAALAGAAPLFAGCAGMQVVAAVQNLGQCDLFFGDAAGPRTVVPIEARSDSIDPARSWIDAPLAFGRAPWLAQGLGGTITQSSVAHSVKPSSWLLAYIRGRLSGVDGRVLASASGAYRWIAIPAETNGVVCSGLCLLAAQSSESPPKVRSAALGTPVPLAFQELTPWLYRVRWMMPGTSLVRFNERYDPGWLAIDAGRLLTHVRVALCANGWLATQPGSNDVILVQITALLQLIAELVGAARVLLLLKALVREPTKRA